MEATVGYSTGAQVLNLLSRYCDDCVESTKGESLQRLERSILQTATGKTVNGGYYRHVGTMGRKTSHHI